MSPFRYQLATENLKLIYQAATVIDRLSDLLLKKPVTVFIVPFVKALNGLGPGGLSAFNFRSLSANDASKIIHYSNLFLSAILSTKK